MLLVASVEPFAIWRHERAHAPGPDAAPVVAVDERERVAGADRAARGAGIRPGMSLAGARQHAPELTAIPACGPDLEAAWASLREEAYGFSPTLLPLRTGVLAFEGGPADAAQFAQAFEARVGGAPTVEEAHLLAYLAHRGHARCHGEPWHLLDRAPALLLRGAGLSPGNLQRLAWLGIERIGPLRAWRAAQLAAFLGEEGEALRRYLHGPRTTRLPLHVPAPTVRVRFEFDEPTVEPYRLEPALARLVERAVHGLGDRSARRITVEAEAGGVRSRATRLAKTPTREAAALRRYAAHALEDTGLTPLGLDGLELVLSDLARVAEQGELWTRRRRARRAAERVHDRYPGQALHYRLADPHALLPEHRYRLVDAATGAPRAEAANTLRARSGGGSNRAHPASDAASSERSGSRASRPRRGERVLG